MSDIEQKIVPPEPSWRIKEWFSDIDEQTLTRLRIFHLELMRFNKSMSLVSRKTELQSDLLHFSDSIIAARKILENADSERIFDIGSGNGLPGLILAALDPKRQIVCIDSNAKKTEFIRHAAQKMHLSNVAVAQTRFEDMKDDIVDCAVSRGFASIAKTLLLARKPLAKDAIYFHMKGTNWVREVAEIPSQICMMWSPKLVADYYLPEGGHKLSLIVTSRIK